MKRLCRSIIGGIIKKVLYGERLRRIPSKREYELITASFRKFEERYIPHTKYIPDLREESQLSEYDFDAYIVGSDQIWRKELSNRLSRFFLDFLSDDSKAKRIAYGACWGKEEWDASAQDIKIIRPLAQKFDAISVRNPSAMKICRELLGVNAEWVLDPALLLTKEDYRKLLTNTPKSKSSGHVLAQASYSSLPIMKKIAESLGLPLYNFRPLPFTKRKTDSLEECIEPSVEEWLKSFDDAEFVLTDHFHGMVFAIIFEKPFAVVNFKAKERMRALTSFLGLEDRLLDNHTFRPELAKLDYSPVRKKLEEGRAKSLKFLTDALGGMK